MKLEAYIHSESANLRRHEVLMSLPRRIFHDWGGVEGRGRVPLAGNSERRRSRFYSTATTIGRVG
ncbi:Hypothetical protein FKW44_013961 [Caligus rogercresseyi]|uniref:Uncharacterized protein n=1 Tax=Caligus rogercresseyi TaxID=217165 RepID=A0A7T8GY79_CALRO|nr:Hypothetical protein FKW44_013961 [Caligus rogercresseyi]